MADAVPVRDQALRGENPRADDLRADDLRADDLRVWARLAPSGLLLVGAGLCVVSDAATRRARNGAPSRIPPLARRSPGHGRIARRGRPAAWVGEGTGGLVLVGAGLSLFGEAVKRRALYDIAARG